MTSVTEWCTKGCGKTMIYTGRRVAGHGDGIYMCERCGVMRTTTQQKKYWSVKEYGKD